VESVEDEWTREMESVEDLDLLFVTFDPNRISVAELKKEIAEFGFEAEVHK
jgi:hypothetical protein